ncbi:MAG: hypothetical protein AB8H86_05770 [Polyangiales bacterium]
MSPTHQAGAALLLFCFACGSSQGSTRTAAPSAAAEPEVIEAEAEAETETETEHTSESTSERTEGSTASTADAPTESAPERLRHLVEGGELHMVTRDGDHAATCVTWQTSLEENGFRLSRRVGDVEQLYTAQWADDGFTVFHPSIRGPGRQYSRGACFASFTPDEASATAVRFSDGTSWHSNFGACVQAAVGSEPAFRFAGCEAAHEMVRPATGFDEALEQRLGRGSIHWLSSEFGSHALVCTEWQFRRRRRQTELVHRTEEGSASYGFSMQEGNRISLTGPNWSGPGGGGGMGSLEVGIASSPHPDLVIAAGNAWFLSAESCESARSLGGPGAFVSAARNAGASASTPLEL